MMSLIKKLADWPYNYHKTARTFPQIFCTPSFQEYADSKRANNKVACSVHVCTGIHIYSLIKRSFLRTVQSFLPFLQNTATFFKTSGFSREISKYGRRIRIEWNKVTPGWEGVNAGSHLSFSFTSAFHEYVTQTQLLGMNTTTCCREGVNREKELWGWARLPKESYTIQWNLWHFMEDKCKFEKESCTVQLNFWHFACAHAGVSSKCARF